MPQGSLWRFCFGGIIGTSGQSSSPSGREKHEESVECEVTLGHNASHCLGAGHHDLALRRARVDFAAHEFPSARDMGELDEVVPIVRAVVQGNRVAFSATTEVCLVDLFHIGNRRDVIGSFAFAFEGGDGEKDGLAELYLYLVIQGTSVVGVVVEKERFHHVTLDLENVKAGIA